MGGTVADTGSVRHVCRPEWQILCLTDAGPHFGLEEWTFVDCIQLAIQMTPTKIINYILKESSNDSNSDGNLLPFQRNYKQINKNITFSSKIK